MSGRLKWRSAANRPEESGRSTNERILVECHGLYTHPNTGLLQLAGTLGIPLLAPRKKITVMVMGNHSAGKSSFINWYTGEHIQKTGVAIETQGFTFITSGRRRDTLTGNATLHLYPHFQKLQEITGVSDYLSTEVSTSRERRFSLVTFIDTPGLVDGDMKYEFDVDKALIWLGERVDLVLVFFDPLGQALCGRTLNIVERLSDKAGERVHFYLSKADQAGSESDRQRVLMQIVQELCKRPALNKCGFNMPTIYIPQEDRVCRCVNQIEEVCVTIEKTIEQTVQHTLDQLERDCLALGQATDTVLQRDSLQVSLNRKIQLWHFLFGCLGYLLPICLLSSFVIGCFPINSLIDIAGVEVAHALHMYNVVVSSLWVWLCGDSPLWGLILLCSSCLLSVLLSRFYAGSKPTLPRSQRRRLVDMKRHMEEVVIPRKGELYELYLRQCVSDYDLQ